MNNGCVTCRSPVCLRAGSISWCRLCLNVNPEPMSLLWTGWIGPTNTTPNQQRTPDWWGRTWPSLSTGWRYSSVCRETHCSLYCWSIFVMTVDRMLPSITTVTKNMPRSKTATDNDMYPKQLLQKNEQKKY